MRILAEELVVQLALFRVPRAVAKRLRHQAVGVLATLEQRLADVPDRPEQAEPEPGAVVLAEPAMRRHSARAAILVAPDHGRRAHDAVLVEQAIERNPRAVESTAGVDGRRDSRGLAVGDEVVG